MRYPSGVARWHHRSNYLVVLASPDPLADADRIGSPCVVVHEPDFDGDPVTAVAFMPHPRVGRTLSSLPLALKERAPV